MAQQTKENILIFGATGYIGAYITEQIVASKSSFGRIAVFTSPNTVETKPQVLEELKANGVEIIVGDLKNHEDLTKAFQGITTVVSAVGRNAIAEQIHWIPLLIQAPSVKRFFPSEYGTDVEYNASSAHEVPHQQKLKVRAALRKAEAESADLSYTFLVTGPYADGRAYLSDYKNHSELGGYDVKNKHGVVLADGKVRISLTTPPDVGRLTVKAILHSEASRNRALRVNSFTTTPLDIIAEFERQTGDKWTISYTPLDKARELEKKAYENNDPWAVPSTLRRIWGEGSTLYEKRDNWLIDGEDTETLEDAVKEAIQVQTSG